MTKLSDIAELAGTSIPTVSLVLNGRGHKLRISDGTRVRVLEAAHQLGYSPNLAARRLRTNQQSRRSLVFALAHPNDGNMLPVSRIVAGMQRRLDTLRQQEGDVLGADVELTIETYVPGELHRLRGLDRPLWYNALLVTGTSPADDAFVESGGIGVPLVVFHRHLRACAVDADNRVAAEGVAKHLLALGHRRLAVLSTRADTQSQQQRIEGFQSVVAKALGSPPPHVMAPGRERTEAAYHPAGVMLSKPEASRPTAIFATQDLLAVGVIRAAYELGLRIPEDLAVVGFGDAEFAPYTIPSLSSVHLPIEEMAAEAAGIMLDIIEQRVSDAVYRLLPTHLVIRESCGGKLASNVSRGNHKPRSRTRRSA